MRNEKNSSKAFTLVELLVVISIIALLLSILMPALSRVKEATRNIVCRSNIKNLGLAARLWSEDNDGWALPALWDRGNSVGDTLLQGYLGTETGDQVMNCPVVKKYAGKTYLELGLENEVAGFANSDNYYNSYGYNLKLCASTSKCPGSYNYSNDNGEPWGKDGVWYKIHGNCKILSVRKPLTTILFAESVLYVTYPEFYTKPTSNPAFNDPSERGRRHFVKKRHVGSNSVETCGEMNISWVDGSVSEQPDDMDVLSADGRRYDINAKYWYGL